MAVVVCDVDVVSDVVCVDVTEVLVVDVGVVVGDVVGDVRSQPRNSRETHLEIPKFKAPVELEHESGSCSMDPKAQRILVTVASTGPVISAITSLIFPAASQSLSVSLFAERTIPMPLTSVHAS